MWASTHTVLPRGEAVKEGCASSNAYLLIFRGVIALELQGEVGEWEAATIMSISFGARMRIVDAA